MATFVVPTYIAKEFHLMDAAYQQKIAEQVDQYADPEGPPMHETPPAFQYWSQNYIAPRMKEVFGVIHVDEIFVSRLLAGTSSERPRFASLGSGECELETKIAKRLISSGVTDFIIDCYELSDVLLSRATKRIEVEALSGRLKLIQCDINNHPLQASYNGILAHHSLHHFVELEHIFDQVKTNLIGNGQFVTYDVVGRNGHMRWPETLQIVNKIWAILDASKKYNHQLRTTWPEFVNFDCSKSGFEGIRAQDIMPTLLSRFHFSHFVAFGGLTEVFFDRAFGRNYDPGIDIDRAFIDWIEYLNSILMEAGTIKPTIIFASMGNMPTTCIVRKHLTPAFCTRPPSG